MYTGECIYVRDYSVDIKKIFCAISQWLGHDGSRVRISLAASADRSPLARSRNDDISSRSRSFIAHIRFPRGGLKTLAGGTAFRNHAGEDTLNFESVPEDTAFLFLIANVHSLSLDSSSLYLTIRLWTYRLILASLPVDLVRVGNLFIATDSESYATVD
jgi:hypothetical protein